MLTRMVLISWSRDPPASASQSAGITGLSHRTRPFLYFLIEIGFYHVGQGGHELLTSTYLPTSASQSAGITGMSHHIWLTFVLLVETGFHRVGQAGLELLTSDGLPCLGLPKCWDDSVRLAAASCTCRPSPSLSPVVIVCLFDNTHPNQQVTPQCGFDLHLADD